LEPNSEITAETVKKDEAGVLHIPLGDPILSFGVDDLIDDERVATMRNVMREWIEIDRQNIVNRWAKVHWIHWPGKHKTNKPPITGGGPAELPRP